MRRLRELWFIICVWARYVNLRFDCVCVALLNKNDHAIEIEKGEMISLSRFFPKAVFNRSKT